MLARLGVGGAKRLRAAFQGCPTSAKTHTSLSCSADGLESFATGAGRSRMCSSISGSFPPPPSSSSRPKDEQDYAQHKRQYTDRAMSHTHASTSSSSCRTDVKQQAAGDHELHVRLAGLWGMPCELLFERQQLLAKVLGPAGCGTPVHALWLLVRAPQLRDATENSLRNSLRQLQRLVSHTDIDRAAVLTAIYKYPWIVEAMSSTAPAAPFTQHPAATAAAARKGGANFSTADAPQQPSRLAAAAAAGKGGANFSTAAGAPATWSLELAAVILELQQADYAEYVANGSSGSRGIRMSPAFASAAVRMYLAFGEAKQRVATAASSMGDRILAALPGPNYKSEAASTDTYTAHPHPTSCSNANSIWEDAVPARPTPSPLLPPRGSQNSDPLPPSGVTEVMQELQQQQQQHLLLQQLLAACPHLTVLPPELLLARYHRLESVVEGHAESARRLVVANPFLLMSHADQPVGTAEGLKHSYA